MESFYRRNRTLFTATITILFLAIAVTLQVFHDRLTSSFGKESFRFTVKHRSIIPHQIIPHLSFGFDNVLADYYWISAIQDFTGWDHREDFYLQYFKNITALDPRFSYPYLFAIFTAPTEKDPSSIDKVSTIADLGIAKLPERWEIPFYMGTMYNMFAKDTAKALHYIEIATHVKDVPPVVPLTYASLTAKKILGKDASRELMQVIRDTTDSETIKHLAEEGIMLTDLTRTLENAVIAYKAKYGIYPKKIEELTRERFLVIRDDLLLSFDVSINQNNGTVRILKR